MVRLLERFVEDGNVKKIKLPGKKVGMPLIMMGSLLVACIVVFALVRLILFIFGKNDDLKLLWKICISAALVIPFTALVVKIWIQKADYKCRIKIYTKIDNAGSPEERVEEIKTLYGNQKTIDDLFSDGDIFDRKAFLINRSKENEQIKESWVSVITVALAALFAAFVSGDLIIVDIKTLDGSLQMIALTVLVLLMSSGTALLVDVILSEKKNVLE